MTALRSHYSVDMFVGAIIAHYIWVMSERYSYLIDWCIFGIPFHKRMNKQKDGDTNTENTPSGGLGQYFVTCKNCMHPMSNFMISEQNIIPKESLKKKDYLTS